jgi:hypothetical protein
MKKHKPIAGAQTPKVNAVVVAVNGAPGVRPPTVAVEPEEIVAYATHMFEMAHADPYFNQCCHVASNLDWLLGFACDQAAKREGWPFDKDKNEYVAPPNWQQAIDAMEKIGTEFDGLMVEHDKRWRAEWLRQAAEKETLNRIEDLRSQVQALELTLKQGKAPNPEATKEGGE